VDINQKMKKNILRFTCSIILMILFSCNKKTVPATNSKASTNSSTSSSAATSPATTATTTTSKTKAAVPKVIAVNDAAAQKTIDGRYFYDLNGKRYWKNNKDGKYYLFNKSMYNNPDFNPVKN
jgi:hypothetical protein